MATRWLQWTLRIFIGAVFILSAVMKLVGIDDFELYIYSYGFFPLNFCFLLARLCIGVELVLALFILVGWFPRCTRLATLGLLILFSLFLCYALLAGRNDSCQCFGRWIDLPPALSLFKNAILILLVLLYSHLSPLTSHLSPFTFHLSPLTSHLSPFTSHLLALLSLLACLALPFIVSVPDNWYFGPHQEPYDAEALAKLATPQEGQTEALIGQGRTLLAFVTPGCPYCRLAHEKISSLASRHHLDTTRIRFVEPADISPQLFLDITYGARPLIMLIDGTQVVATYHLRNIDETEVSHFLKNAH